MTLEEVKALRLPLVADREFVREILVVEAERRERDEDGHPAFCRFSGNLRGAADLVDFAYEKMVPAIDWLVAEVERLQAGLRTPTRQEQIQPVFKASGVCVHGHRRCDICEEDI